MLLYWILAVFAGIAGVLQSGINRKLAEEYGLAYVLHASNLLVLVGGIVILTAIAAFTHGEVAELLRLKVDFGKFSWWLLLPGLMGLFIIVISPLAIAKIDAVHVFIAMVFGQVFASALWDHFLEGKPLDRWRVIGCALTLMGAYSISLSKP